MSDLDMTQPIASTATPARPGISRINMILLAVALIQVLLVAWVYWPNPTGAGGTPLLAGLSAEQVTALRISDAQGQTVELERSDDGWVMAGTDGYPANSEKISTTLSSLIGLTTNRLVTNTPGSHARLQVAADNFVRQITLATSGGDKVIYLGSSAGAGATHVRLDGSDATYLAAGLDTWQLETTPSSWVNTSYFSVPQDEIVSVTLQNAAGTLTFVKAEDDSWTLQDRAEGEEVLPANISTLIARVASVNLTAPLGTADKPEYGLADPLATITVRTENAQGATAEYTLLLGAKDDANAGYFFKASTSPHYVRIAAFTGDEFANKTRADFLAQPEAGDAAGRGEQSEGALPITTPAVESPAVVTGTDALTDSQTITPDAAASGAVISSTQAITATQQATTTD